MVDSSLWAAYIVVLAGTFLIQTGVAYWAYSRQWDREGSRWFVVMAATGAPFVGFLALFVALSDPLSQQLAYVVSNFFGLVTIAAFSIFASTYTGADFHRYRVVQGAIAATLVGYVALAVTNPTYNLLMAEVTAVSEPFPHLVIQRGIGHQLLVALMAIPAYYGLYVLGNYLLETGQRAGRQLSLLIVGGAAVGIFDHASQYTSLMPVDGFSHAAFGAALFYFCTALALFRFDLLDVKPVARSTVIEHLRDPVLVLDDKQRVVDFNEAATQIWAALPEQRRESFDAVCPDLADTVAAPLAAGDTSVRLPLPYDGQERHYSVTVSAIERGRVDRSGWYAVHLRDISELERSRWQLQAQNERLDQVASAISHDLRNPIQVVDGRLEHARTGLAEGTVDPETRAAVDEDLESVEDATDRMQSIIDDLLTIARQGKTVESTERISLAAVARDSWDTVDTGEATMTIADDRTVRAERSKLRTVFENLFRNSVDHGSASVAVEIAPTADGFMVTDSGPGIAEQHRSNVFEYGYTTSREGTGLGLSIVRTMAESHGWTVALDDAYEQGTRFVFGNVTDAHPTDREALTTD